jgi:hypothetical protein
MRHAFRKVRSALVGATALLAACACCNLTDRRAGPSSVTNKRSQLGWELTAIAPARVTRQNDWVQVRLGNRTGANSVYWQREFLKRLPFSLEIWDNGGKQVPLTGLGRALFRPEDAFFGPEQAVVERSFSHQVLPRDKSTEQGFHISEFFELYPGEFVLRAGAKVRSQGPDMVSISVDTPFSFAEGEPLK